MMGVPFRFEMMGVPFRFPVSVSAGVVAFAWNQLQAWSGIRKMWIYGKEKFPVEYYWNSEDS